MQSFDRKFSSERIDRFIRKLEAHPEVFERIERILEIVEDETGEAMTADEAEELLVQELRKMGHDALQEWAMEKEARIEKEYAGRSRVVKREKKSSGGTAGSGK
jgi:hypothetical protein